MLRAWPACSAGPGNPSALLSVLTSRCRSQGTSRNGRCGPPLSRPLAPTSRDLALAVRYRYVPWKYVQYFGRYIQYYVHITRRRWTPFARALLYCVFCVHVPEHQAHLCKSSTWPHDTVVLYRRNPYPAILPAYQRATAAVWFIIVPPREKQQG